MMKRRSKFFSRLSRPLGYQIALIGLVVVSVVTLALLRSRVGARQLATLAMDSSADKVRFQSRINFEQVNQLFDIIEAWGEEGLVAFDDIVGVNKLMVSVLRTIPVASAVLLANDRGARYKILRHEDGGYETKWVTDGKRTRWFLDPKGSRLGGDRSVDEFYSEWGDWMGESRSRVGEVIRTDAYALAVTGEPGRTIASAHRVEGPRAGEHWYVAVVASTARLSEATRALHPTPHGLVVVVDERDYMVAWPAQEGETRNLGTYEHVSAASSPALSAAILLRDESNAAPFEFKVAEKAWWTRSFLISSGDADSPAWAVIVVPESDLRGLSEIKDFHIVVGVVLTILFAIWLLHGLVREFERRLAVSEKALRLGRYTLEAKVGQGGDGTVFRAGHAMLQRPTAVKVLSSRHATSRTMARFEREVQMTSSLTHPNTVEVYDYGNTEEGTFYYAMEFIDGVTLAELVSVCGPVTPGRAVHFLVQMCGSMVEAHDIGLVHRDIKPANVMVCERGGLFDTIKVLDFGIAIAAGSDEDDVVGTPLYMAPESIQNLSGATTATDVYAIGAVAYFLITGRPVFDGDNVLQVCAQQLCDPPVPPSKQIDGVPPDFNDLILRCLAKKQEERPSAAELLSALEALDCGTEWSEVHAARWWRHHAQDLPPRYREVCGDKQVLTVDLDQHP